MTSEYRSNRCQPSPLYCYLLTQHHSQASWCLTKSSRTSHRHTLWPFREGRTRSRILQHQLPVLRRSPRETPPRVDRDAARGGKLVGTSASVAVVGTGSWRSQKGELEQGEKGAAVPCPLGKAGGAWAGMSRRRARKACLLSPGTKGKFL